LALESLRLMLKLKKKMILLVWNCSRVNNNRESLCEPSRKF